MGSGIALATTLQVRRAAAALGFGQNLPACTLTAEQETGPYYISDELLRSSIVENRPGVPLSLRILLIDARSCKPLPDAAVDIWHCDALGVYSGFTQQHPMGPGGPPPPDGRMGPPPDGRMGPPPENHPTDQLTFLRGIQLADEKGAVHFETIFPGCYMGRTNHIHFKVRMSGEAARHSYEGGHTSHTGQIFFPEELAVKLMQTEPYSNHDIRRTTQTEDGVFNDQHGAMSMARIVPLKAGDFSAGLNAELIAAVDPTATPTPARRRMGPGPFADEGPQR